MTPKRWILSAAVLGSGIVFLDSLVVNVALPRIGRDLPRAFLGVLEGQSYVYNGYLLSLCALLILAGALTDYFGRRRMFAVGLFSFGVTSLLCGLAPNMELLVFFRVLQGAAGALLVPGSLALLTANFEGEEQGRAFGIWAGASAAAAILGPVVGGLAFGAIYGQQRDWRDPGGYIGLALGALFTIVLPFWMARAPHPLIPLGLFRSRNFTVTNLATLLVYGALYVMGYYVILFMQGSLGYTALAAGLSFLPGSLFLVLLSPRFGRLAGRLGPRWFMAVGPAIMAAGVLWYVRTPASSAPWVLRGAEPASFWPPLSYFTDILPASVLFGLGIAILVAPLTTALMRSVPVHNAGVASAINNAISRIGPQLAGALIFIFVTNSFYSDLSSRLPGIDVASAALRSRVSPLNTPVDPNLVAVVRDASTTAFHLAMLISALLLVAGALVSAAGIENPRHLATEEEASGPVRSGAPAAAG